MDPWSTRTPWQLDVPDEGEADTVGSSSDIPLAERLADAKRRAVLQRVDFRRVLLDLVKEEDDRSIPSALQEEHRREHEQTQRSDFRSSLDQEDSGNDEEEEEQEEEEQEEQEEKKTKDLEEEEEEWNGRKEGLLRPLWSNSRGSRTRRKRSRAEAAAAE